MSRIKVLRGYINKKLSEIPDENDKIQAAAHLYGVSLSATIIAKKRGLNPEIASMAGMLHDLYAYESGTYEEHARKGAQLAEQILNELHLTSDEETDLICSAIYHHDDKLTIDSPMDEVLKDADVTHHVCNDISKEVKEKERARYESLQREFGIEPAKE